MTTSKQWKSFAFTLCATFTIIMLSSTLAGEKTPTVDEIVQNTNRVAYYQGRDGRARVSMTITDKQGRERHRGFTILRRDERPPESEADKYGKDEYMKDQKFYVYFHRPGDVEGTVFMVWKHVALDKDDDRWLYLPGLDLKKRIAASDERTSFVGSHFYYEDVSGRNTNEDKHELEKTTSNYYVLKNTPKKPKLVEFKYYRMWIHKSTFIPVKIEYFDDRDNKYREYQVLAVQQIQGYPTVTKSRVKDLQGGGQTVIEYTDVEYDIGLEEDIFTERYLRRAPAKYLKME